MIVVSNATPLIGLASINRFDLLHELFGEIIISQAVYDEVVVAGRADGGKEPRLDLLQPRRPLRLVRHGRSL